MRAATGTPPLPATGAGPRRRLLTLGLGLAAAGGLLALAIPRGPESPAVWAAGESVKVSPEMVPPTRSSVWSAEQRRVRLHAGRGEYVGVQVVVRGGPAPLERVELQVGPLTSAAGRSLGPEHIDLFRQHYLKVTVPSQWDNERPVPETRAGEYPVQMVPLLGKQATFTVPARRNQPVWVDLWVPESQAPGDYRGEARVLAGGKPLETLKVELTVWDFTLPRETHLKTYVPTGPEQLRWAFGLRPEQEEELAALEDRFFQLAHQHRLNFQPSAGEELQVEWGGRYRQYLDGSAFTRRAGAGVGQNLVVLGFPEEGGQAEIGGHARKALEWWKKQGFKADLVAYVWDEPREDEEFAAAAQRARWIRAAAGEDLPRLVTTVSPERFAKGLFNVWGEIPASEIAARRAAGDRVWATNQGYAAAPYADTPGYAGRTQGWMAWRLGLDAWHFWDGCYWTDKQNITDERGRRLPYRILNADPARYVTDTWREPLTFDQRRNPRHRDWIRINGDGVLFYPGTPAGLAEPLASFTMKSLRRGLQDYEYLWLLQQAGRPADDLLDRLVPRAGEWARDPEAWDAARLELGRRLDGLAVDRGKEWPSGHQGSDRVGRKKDLAPAERGQRQVSVGVWTGSSPASCVPTFRRAASHAATLRRPIR